MTKRYEYTVLSLNDWESVAKVLTEWGRAGWRVIHIQVDVDLFDCKTTTAFLEREILV